MRAPVLFLGETLVDLICEHPVDGRADADSFVPHCGGAPTNAAIVAARCGAAVAVAGGAGDDQWGAWLEARLRAERIDLRWWRRLRGVQTAVAFDVIDRQARPDFLIYGMGIEPLLEAIEPELEQAISACAALELGSNTLIGQRERQITEHARSLALSEGKPILVDVNLRLARWPSALEAVEAARALCKDAFLVKASIEEARLMTSEDDPETAAGAICEELEAKIALVTLGAEGALAHGAVRARAEAVEAEVVDTTGAGDALLGVLVAALAETAFDPVAIELNLQTGVEAAARSTEGYGAVDSLPESIALH